MLPGSLALPFTSFCSKLGCPEGFLRLSFLWNLHLSCLISLKPCHTLWGFYRARSETPAREVPWRSTAFSYGVCILSRELTLWDGGLQAANGRPEQCKAGWWARWGGLALLLTPWPFSTSSDALSFSPSSLSSGNLEGSVVLRGPRDCTFCVLTSSTHHRGFLRQDHCPAPPLIPSPAMGELPHRCTLLQIPFWSLICINMYLVFRFLCFFQCLCNLNAVCLTQ